MRWPSARASRVVAALRRIGWVEIRRRGSHVVFARAGWREFVWSHHDGAEIGPRMLARIAKYTGLDPGDL